MSKKQKIKWTKMTLKIILADDGTTDLNWAQDESVVVGETDSLYVLGWERQVETCQDRNRTAQLSAAGIIPPKIALNCFDPQPTLKAANFQPSSSLISLLKVVWPLVVKITSYVTPAMMVSFFGFRLWPWQLFFLKLSKLGTPLFKFEGSMVPHLT